MFKPTRLLLKSKGIRFLQIQKDKAFYFKRGLWMIDAIK